MLSISALLDETGRFREQAQKRYDDTEEPFLPADNPFLSYYDVPPPIGRMGPEPYE